MDWRRLIARLGSPRLAAVLMSISIAMLVLAVVVPQSGYLGAAFAQFRADNPLLAKVIVSAGLDRLFSGWLIVLVASLLCVNVLACTVTRLVAFRRGPRLLRSEVASFECAEPASYLDLAETTLRSRRWRVTRVSDTELAAEKGRSGIAGSVVLHLSILVITLGAVASSQLTFRGEMVLSDGQSLSDARENYLSIQQEPKRGDGYTGALLALDGTEIGYEKGVLVSAVASMRAVDPSGKVVTRRVSVNHPLDAAGKSYLLMESGLAAKVVLQREGSASQRSTINLREKTPFGWQDSITVPTAAGSSVEVRLVAMPVKLDQGQKLPAEALSLRDPHLFVDVAGAGSSRVTRLLAPGESVEIAPGMQLTFEDAAIWNRYLVRGDQGRWISYVGFWLAVVGAASRFAVPQRTVGIRSRTQDGRMVVAFRSTPWAGLSVNGDEKLVSLLQRL